MGSASPQFTEKRQSPRRRMIKRAMVTPEGMSHRITCIVRNISEGGIEVEFPTILDIHQNFSIFIEVDGTHARCEKIWNEENRCGAKFLTPLTQIAPAKYQAIHEGIGATPFVDPEVEFIERKLRTFGKK